MKNKYQIFLIILLILTAPLHAEENLPPPFEALFKISVKGLTVAEMHNSLTQLDNDNYVYRSETNSIGLASIFYELHITEESRWYQKDQQLRSLNYSYDRIKKKKETHVKILFNWEDYQINCIRNGIKSNFKLQAGMTDKLLYQIKFMRDLKMGYYPTSYTVVGGKKIKTYDFQYLGEELIKTPIGTFNTMKFSLQKYGEKESAIFWSAKELHYLPIKIESIVDDGIVAIIVINKLSGLGL